MGEKGSVMAVAPEAIDAQLFIVECEAPDPQLGHPPTVIKWTRSQAEAIAAYDEHLATGCQEDHGMRYPLPRDAS